MAQDLIRGKPKHGGHHRLFYRAGDNPPPRKPAGFTPLLPPYELTSAPHSGGVMASSIDTRGLPALAFVGLGLPELDPERGQGDVKAVELAGIRYPSKRRTPCVCRLG